MLEPSRVERVKTLSNRLRSRLWGMANMLGDAPLLFHCVRERYSNGKLTGQPLQ